jgi:hypothetical protein
MVLLERYSARSSCRCGRIVVLPQNECKCVLLADDGSGDAA